MSVTPSAPLRSPPARDPLTDDERYEAIRHRDAEYDGSFVYAVRTTGVYCRPSCAARLARRHNVGFYPSPAEAEHAGFRACLRCRPNAASQEQRHAEAVRTACRLIENADAPPSLDTLAEAVALSPFHFHRIFKRLTGVTPKAYGAAVRAGRVAANLDRGGTVTQALFDAGFNASSRFYDDGGHRLGMAPSAYRQGGVGEAIRFAVGECRLGTVLVAATQRGVCAIAFGDDPETLVRELRGRYPKADITAGDATFERTVAQVVDVVETPALGLELPLDIRGTAFQQRVWEALRAIPVGRTASYSDVAEVIGAPGAVRAVAGACAANPLALVIPCHRVVRADGTLSGYRWGVARKRDLLTREAEATSARDRR